MTKPNYMIARDESRCRLCGGRIRPGDEIKQVGKRSWGHPDCVDRAGRV